MAIEAIVEADRVEHVAEVTQMGQQPDRALGALAGVRLHAVAHGLVQRNARIAQIVAAPELRQAGAPHRPQPASCEHLIQLGQIQVHQEQAMAKVQRLGHEAPVPHPAGIDRAAQRRLHATGAAALGERQRHRVVVGVAQQLHHQCTPRPCATSTPLRRPSSWKPKPHAAPANQVCCTPWISALRACAATAAAFCTGWR